MRHRQTVTRLARPTSSPAIRPLTWNFQGLGKQLPLQPLIAEEFAAASAVQPLSLLLAIQVLISLRKGLQNQIKYLPPGLVAIF
jgi:hypothetical protein